MLRWRLVLGVLIIAALVMLCWLDTVVTRPGAFLLPVALMVGWACVVELLDMLNKRGRQPLPWAVYTGVLITILLAGMPVIAPTLAEGNIPGRLGWLAIGLAIGLLLSCVGELQRYDGRWHTAVNLGLEAFAILYIGGLLGFIVQLRLLGGGPWGENGQWGMVALASLVATVKMSDTGQYTVGRLIGRHKLAPLVSPGKTWEGAVGGIVFAFLGAWLLFAWGAPQMIGPTTNLPPWWALAVFAVVVGVSGIIGDLTESMLKRECDVKDSSTWLPGFGGVLDLLDSLLGAAPVVYLLWMLRVVGP